MLEGGSGLLPSQAVEKQGELRPEKPKPLGCPGRITVDHWVAQNEDDTRLFLEPHRAVCRRHRHQTKLSSAFAIHCGEACVCNLTCRGSVCSLVKCQWCALPPTTLVGITGSFSGCCLSTRDESAPLLWAPMARAHCSAACGPWRARTVFLPSVAAPVFSRECPGIYWCRDDWWEWVDLFIERYLFSGRFSFLPLNASGYNGAVTVPD